MNPIKQVLIGVSRDPQVVAAARSLAYFAIPILIDVALVYLGDVKNPVVLSLAPGISGFLRVLEGAIDRQLKPQQNNVNPPPVAGGGGKDLAQ